MTGPQRRAIRIAARIGATAGAVLLVLTFAARWDNGLRLMLAYPLAATLLLVLVAGGLVFAYGEGEDNGRRILAGAALTLAPVALLAAVWLWWWR